MTAHAGGAEGDRIMCQACLTTHLLRFPTELLRWKSVYLVTHRTLASLICLGGTLRFLRYPLHIKKVICRGEKEEDGGTKERERESVGIWLKTAAAAI